MYNTSEMYKNYAPVNILRNSLKDAQKTKDYLLTLNNIKDIKQEITKIDCYIQQCHESIINLQKIRNKKIRDDMEKINVK